ncbi:MAG: YebC/PmpR family DNA-binding transcriptional regulator [Patescibacteria group bacterium]
MAGHNKWKQIKHKKGAADAKRSKLFAMLGRAIAMESKKAAGSRSAPGLARAIEKARAENMPNDNIDRAVAKGAGAGAQSYEDVVYEAYGPGGAALIIEGTTDSKNRTNNEIKHLLAEHGGTLGTPGSASWAFTKTTEGWEPNMLMPIPPSDVDKLIALLEKIEEHDDIKEVFTNADLPEEEDGAVKI